MVEFYKQFICFQKCTQAYVYIMRGILTEIPDCLV